MDTFDQELEEIKPELLAEAVAIYEKFGLTPAQIYEKCCDIETKAKLITEICSTFSH